MSILLALRTKVEYVSVVGRTILRPSVAACRLSTLIVLTRVRMSHSLMALSCSSVSFPAPTLAKLSIEAHQQDDSLLTLANTRAAMSLAKEVPLWGQQQSQQPLPLSSMPQMHFVLCCSVELLPFKLPVQKSQVRGEDTYAIGNFTNLLSSPFFALRQ